MRRFLFRWPAVLLALLVLLVPSLSRAQRAEPDKDAREIERYTLTVDKLQQLSQLLSDAAVAIKRDPSLKNSIDLSGGDGHASLDAMTRQIASSPALTALLAKDGFAPREFTVMTMALLQASLAVYGKPKEQTVEQYAATIHANPANLVFVQQHTTELAEVHKKAMALDADDSGN